MPPAATMQEIANCAGLRTASSLWMALPANNSLWLMRKSARSAREVDRKKLWGRLVASPFLFCLVELLLLFLLCLFLSCHGSILPSIVDGNCNDRLLHSSFVEPLKSEVKKKISSAPVTLALRTHSTQDRTDHGASFITTSSTMPVNRSCHASAIIPGRRFFLQAANIPSAQPRSPMTDIAFSP